MLWPVIDPCSHIQCLGVFENMLSIRNSCTFAFAPCLSMSPHSEELLLFSQNGGAVLFSSGAQAGLVNISCCKQKPLTEKLFFSEWTCVPRWVKSLYADIDALKKAKSTSIFTNYILFLIRDGFCLTLHYIIVSDGNIMVPWYRLPWYRKITILLRYVFIYVLKGTLNGNTMVLPWSMSKNCGISLGHIKKTWHYLDTVTLVI